MVGVEDFLTQLREALQRPLPGAQAQERLVPSTRKPPIDGTTAWLQPAAVLVLLYVHRGELHLALTRRTQMVATHKGQIAWPGGAREGEESPAETALREAHEELGVSPQTVDTLGLLTPLPTGSSGFLVTPVVGRARDRPAFRLDVNEVAELLEVPLAALRAPGILRQETWSLHGAPATISCYRLGPNVAIWGVTAMILSEFLAVVESLKPSSLRPCARHRCWT